jgi:phosphate transport system substrate-binding protein
MSRAVILALAMAGLVVTGACADSATPDIDGERIAADLPVLDGSTSTRPLRMFIVCAVLDAPCEWVEWLDGSRAVVPAEGSSVDVSIPSSGTHGSYVALAEGRADLILTARLPSDDEVQLAASNGVTFDIAPIALDAFVFLVNASNPVKGLDLEQVRGIFTGTIRDWSGVGGADRPIQPYQRNETSGSQVLMERLVMRGTPMVDARDMMLPTMMAPFDAISRDPDGIGYSVYYFATQMLANDEIDLLALDGSAPDPTSIASGEYPLVTEVYAVLPSGSARDSTARMLRDLLVTDAGQTIIERSGYVPLPSPQSSRTISP